MFDISANRCENINVMVVHGEEGYCDIDFVEEPRSRDLRVRDIPVSYILIKKYASAFFFARDDIIVSYQ